MLRFCMPSLMQDGSGADCCGWEQAERTAQEEAACTTFLHARATWILPLQTVSSEQLCKTCWSSSAGATHWLTLQLWQHY